MCKAFMLDDDHDTRHFSDGAGWRCGWSVKAPSTYLLLSLDDTSMSCVTAQGELGFFVVKSIVSDLGIQDID